MRIIKKLLNFMFEVLWANFAQNHRIFTGEFPTEQDKQDARKSLRLT